MNGKSVKDMSFKEFCRFMISDMVFESEWGRDHLFFWICRRFRFYNPLFILAKIDVWRQVLGPITIVKKDDRIALQIYRDFLASFEKLMGRPLIVLVEKHWKEYQIEIFLERELIRQAKEIVLSEQHELIEELEGSLSLARRFNFRVNSFQYYIDKARKELEDEKSGKKSSIFSGGPICEGDC